MNNRRRSASAPSGSDEVVAAIKETGPGAYLLVGENGLEREEAAQRLVEELTPEATRPFNYDLFHAEERECSAEAIAGAVMSYPTFAEVRVVVVYAVDEAREEIGAELARLAAQPLESTVLLMLAEKLDMRKKWASALHRHCTVFTLDIPKGKAFIAWVKRRAQRHGITLSEEAAVLLAEYIGEDVYRAASELEKLALVVQPRTRVEVDDVEAVVGITREDTVYQLADHIAQLDVEGALKIAHRMVRADQHPAYLVGMLVRQWQRLRLAADLLSARREHELGELIGENRPFLLKKYLAQARTLGRDRIRTGFRLALAAESAIKRGWPPEVVLDGLICQLAGRRRT